MRIKDRSYIDPKTNIKYPKFALIEEVRVGDKIVETTVLNLGKEFSLNSEYWPTLVNRIKCILANKSVLFPLSQEIEILAKDLAEKIRLSADNNNNLEDKSKDYKKKNYIPVCVTDSFTEYSRTIGVAHAALSAMEELGFADILIAQGFTPDQTKIAMALVAARMEHPSSEEETFRWLKSSSAIGDMLGIDFNLRSVMSIHRASKLLLLNKYSIEEQLISNIDKYIAKKRTIFNYQQSEYMNKGLFFYDLTNTYFEGKPKSSKAKRGYSKEKRYDCLLESIAIVIDSNSYVRTNKFYPGNVSEYQTLPEVIEILNPKKGSVLVMDCGISSEQNLGIILDKGLNYLVVNNETGREFDFSHPYTTIFTNNDNIIHIYREEVVITLPISNDESTTNTTINEARLFCHSPSRQAKEESMNLRLRTKFENGLSNISVSILSKYNSSLKKSKTPKVPLTKSQVMRSIGVLENKYNISRHYDIKPVTIHNDNDDHDPYVTELIYKFQPLPNTKMTLPGVYCLRTNYLILNDKEIWDAYISLTTVESIFKSLKSELGLRPIYHKSEINIDSHLYVSLLSYQFVNFIRKKLAKSKINFSWHRIVQELCTHYLYANTYKTIRGPITIKKTGNPTETQKLIYNSLDISYAPKIINNLH
jgi:hypothetical protein